jgi:putative two-component system response regulator
MIAEAQKPVILAVDDTPENLRLIGGLLKADYRVRVATQGSQALELAAQAPQPALILLDIMMPAMDGYEVCARLKSHPATADIPVIFLTALSERENEKRGFDLGAVDYLAKPLDPLKLAARVRTHVELKQARDRLRDQNTYLEGEVDKRTRQVQRIQDATIVAMASLAETRDNETGNHILRTQRYVRALALRLRENPRYAAALDDATIALLYKSAPLHDIGKVGIPDQILLKPGKLDEAEFTIMKTHAALGREAIDRAAGHLDEEADFLTIAAEIAHCHHEKWDGSGYPNGLSGEAIPLSARLMAVADVYDALISKRVYKPAFSHEEAMRIILEGKGRHFDPEIIEAFALMQDDFRQIAQEFADA